MQTFTVDNPAIVSFTPTLEDLEFTEFKKLNVLQKMLVIHNRKRIKIAILRIGTMIAYKGNSEQHLFVRK